MTTSIETMPICAEAEIIMWTRRFYSYFQHFFYQFNTQHYDIPPHSHHPNHLSPSYAQSSPSFQFKPPTDRFKSPSSLCYSHIRRSTTSIAGSRTAGPMSRLWSNTWPSVSSGNSTYNRHCGRIGGN